MRLDHIAFRTFDRLKTMEFFRDAFGYRLQTEFDIAFPDGTTARCLAMEPPEKPQWVVPWTHFQPPFTWTSADGSEAAGGDCEYHVAPEIFISDGDMDSIVGEWVSRRDGVGGIHHLAYQVDDVKMAMAQWAANGYAEFSSESPLVCPGLVQVFTKPSVLTGVVFEFIQRGKHGFCAANVKELMLSTAEADHPGAEVRAT